MDDAAEMFWVLRERRRVALSYSEAPEQPAELERFSSFDNIGKGAVVCVAHNQVVLVYNSKRFAFN